MMSSDAWTVLRHRDFAIVCGARFAVTLALQIINVSVLWYVYDVTGSAYALAYLGLAGFVPALVLPIVTGYVADRFDRRRVMFVTDLLLGITALALLHLVGGGSGIVWPIYLIVICSSASRAFHNPAAQAIIPSLVPQQLLSSGIALASSTFQFAQIMGPALGGLLYALDARLPFFIAAVLYGAAALGALAVRTSQAPTGGRQPVRLVNLMAGFAFAWNKPVVLGAVALDAAVVFLGGLVVLMPIFAKDILLVGAEGLGLLRAAPAVGAVIMALWLANNDYVQRGTGRKLFAAIAVYGFATAAFGFSTSFVLSLLLVVLVGASDMISVVIRHTMVQAETPDDLRGRLAAVNSLFISSSSELSQVRAGFAAGILGAWPAAVIGGLMAASLAWIWPRLFPALAARDHLVDPTETSGKPEEAKA